MENKTLPGIDEQFGGNKKWQLHVQSKTERVTENRKYKIKKM